MTAGPPVTPGAEGYWEATRERRLVVQHCPACDRWIHPPRPRCPSCAATELEFVDPPATPTLHSWAAHPPRGEAPATMVVLVDLAPRARMISRLVGDAGPGAAAPSAGLRAGAVLALAWEPLDDGRALPVFRLGSPSD